MRMLLPFQSRGRRPCRHRGRDRLPADAQPASSTAWEPTTTEALPQVADPGTIRNLDHAYGRFSRRFRIQSGDLTSLFQTACCCEAPAGPTNRIVVSKAPRTLCMAFHTRGLGRPASASILQIARKCRLLGTQQPHVPPAAAADDACPQIPVSAGGDPPSSSRSGRGNRGVSDAIGRDAPPHAEEGVPGVGIVQVKVQRGQASVSSDPQGECIGQLDIAILEGAGEQFKVIRKPQVVVLHVATYVPRASRRARFRFA